MGLLLPLPVNLNLPLVGYDVGAYRKAPKNKKPACQMLSWPAG